MSFEQVGSVEQYLEKGPGFIFLYHPALGPLWDVIAQKIRGGALMVGSELVLEVRASLCEIAQYLGHSILHRVNCRQYFVCTLKVNVTWLHPLVLRLLPSCLGSAEGCICQRRLRMQH